MNNTSKLDKLLNKSAENINLLTGGELYLTEKLVETQLEKLGLRKELEDTLKNIGISL
jgi:hypothetical protein